MKIIMTAITTNTYTGLIGRNFYIELTVPSSLDVLHVY